MSGGIFKDEIKENLKKKIKNQNIPDNAWMVRACFLYEDEFGDCKSIRGRFQQYFVFGEFEDCNPWKHDHENCLRWKNEQNKESFDNLIAHEEARRAKRLDPHYNNPVWENRTEPPPNWNAPLPPFLAEKQKNTYLEAKAVEMREGKGPSTAEKLCVIM